LEHEHWHEHSFGILVSSENCKFWRIWKETSAAWAHTAWGRNEYFSDFTHLLVHEKRAQNDSSCNRLTRVNATKRNWNRILLAQRNGNDGSHPTDHSPTRWKQTSGPEYHHGRRWCRRWRVILEFSTPSPFKSNSVPRKAFHKSQNKTRNHAVDHDSRLTNPNQNQFSSHGELSCLKYKTLLWPSKPSFETCPLSLSSCDEIADTMHPTPNDVKWLSSYCRKNHNPELWKPVDEQSVHQQFYMMTRLFWPEEIDPSLFPDKVQHSSTW
jgi:hypothetical protein